MSGGNGVETRWSVAEIQTAIVRHTGNHLSIPNVSFGFFKGIECDLIQVTGSSYLHEYEIKRSWSDFLADFKKKHFHDDVRIAHLTFVLPESFADERLRKFCEENYKTFKRRFDFLFYREDVCGIVERKLVCKGCRMAYEFAPQHDTRTYITEEMRAVIDANDRAEPYRRRLFLEELAQLYRLGVIRFWHRPAAAPEVREE